MLYQFGACLSHLNIDHGSLLRRTGGGGGGRAKNVELTADVVRTIVKNTFFVLSLRLTSLPKGFGRFFQAQRSLLFWCGLTYQNLKTARKKRKAANEQRGRSRE